MSDLPDQIARSDEPEHRQQTEEARITDWLNALNPTLLTPSAWHSATAGNSGKRTESRIGFFDSQGRRVLEITRRLARYDRPPTDEAPGFTEIECRDSTDGQVYLQNDYTLSNEGSPDVFRLVPTGDGLLAQGAGQFIDEAAELATQPGSRIEVQDALGETHTIPASKRGWDFDNARYDTHGTNPRVFAGVGASAAVGQLVVAEVPQLPPPSP